MVGLGPTIHEFACRTALVVEKLVDARAKPWHDELRNNRDTLGKRS
jgi:hypothetical protein